jgi:hypothetical protein
MRAPNVPVKSLRPAGTGRAVAIAFARFEEGLE